MSTARDSPMAGQISESDVIINRMNLALARSQRLINSWRAPQNVGGYEEEPKPADDVDGDFEGLTEQAGLGSKAADEEDDTPATVLRKKRLESRDKLLEQLLGKKAAQAHKKSQAAGKSMAASKHVAPKALTNRPKVKREAEDESEDEGGRATAFRSRKGDRPRVVEAKVLAADSHHVNGSENASIKDESGSSDDDGGGGGKASNFPRTAHRNHAKKAKKAEKSMSYLDELLSQKARKKKRKEQDRP